MCRIVGEIPTGEADHGLNTYGTPQQPVEAVQPPMAPSLRNTAHDGGSGRVGVHGNGNGRNRNGDELFSAPSRSFHFTYSDSAAFIAAVAVQTETETAESPSIHTGYLAVPDGARSEGLRTPKSTPP
jgi:hypothetical protein